MYSLRIILDLSAAILAMKEELQQSIRLSGLINEDSYSIHWRWQRV